MQQRSHRPRVDPRPRHHARRAWGPAQIATIASWRRGEETLRAATARAEAMRLAKRIRALDDDLAANREQNSRLVKARAPKLLDLPGVGAVTAAVILTVWARPERIRNETAFAMIGGICPVPASSGSITRNRLNCGRERRLNRALNTIVLTRMRSDPATRVYIERRQSGRSHLTV